jgi:hypothetical protein
VSDCSLGAAEPGEPHIDLEEFRVYLEVLEVLGAGSALFPGLAAADAVPIDGLTCSC